MSLTNLPPWFTRQFRNHDQRIFELERRLLTGPAGGGPAGGSITGAGAYVWLSSITFDTPVSTADPILPFRAGFKDWFVQPSTTGGFVDLSDTNGVVQITQPGIYSLAGTMQMDGIDASGCIFGMGTFLTPGNVFPGGGGGGGVADPSHGLPASHFQQQAAFHLGPLDRVYVSAMFNTTPTFASLGHPNAELIIQQIST